MARRIRNWAGIGIVVAGLLAGDWCWSGEPAAAPTATGKGPISAELAREQAKLMHQVYLTTLDVMHHRYFHANRAILPARAMEDVFAEMERQSRIQARWIAVNTPAMSLNHEAQTDFEKQAVEVLSAGKEEFESVADGLYQRATVVPLKAGCVDCHVGFLRSPGKTPRIAGLVIRVPLTADGK